MMTLYYLSSPLLAKLEKTRFIYYALLPGLVLLMVSVPKGWSPFQNFAHYLPVYLLGMFLSRYRESIFNTTDKHVELVTLAYLILISFAILVGNQKIEMPFIKLINALLLFFLFHRYESFLSLTRIGDVGLLSYGIYLIHPYVFACIRLLTGTRFGEPLAMNGKLPWESGAMLVAIILSILATFVSAKVLGKHSRLLIGCQQAKMQRVLATNHSPAKLPGMSRPVP
jgi:peptidoglycan/LPS O-acetylase OafA/YrhL